MWMLNKIGNSVESCSKPFLSKRNQLICPAFVLSLKLQFDNMFKLKHTRWRSEMVRSFRARPWCQTLL